MTVRKFIVLDRDGVINQDSAEFIKSPQEWQPITGSLEAIARLSGAGYSVIVVTNQSAIGRGMISANTLNRIHEKMLQKVRQLGGEISAIFFCPHTDEDQCQCRKPKAGLFQELARSMHCNLAETVAVGDSLRDLQAAQIAGSQPVLVQTGNGKKTQKWLQENSDHELDAVPCYQDLNEFVDVFLDKSFKS